MNSVSSFSSNQGKATKCHNNTIGDLEEEVVQRLLKEDGNVKLCSCQHFDVWKIESYGIILKVFKRHCCSNEYLVMKKLHDLGIPNFQKVICEVKDIRKYHRNAIAMELPGTSTLRSLIESNKMGNNILYSILSQCYYAMLVAFETQKLTHYNLNVDTIFIKKTTSKYIVYSVKGKHLRIPTFGVIPVITSFIYAYSSALDNEHFASRIDNVERGALSIIHDFLGDIYSLFDDVSKLTIKIYCKSQPVEDGVESLDKEIHMYEEMNEYNTDNTEDEHEETMSISTNGQYDDILVRSDHYLDNTLSSLDERSILTITEDPKIDVRSIINFRDSLIKISRVNYNMKHYILEEYDSERDFVEYIIEYLNLETDGDIIFDRYFYVSIVKIMNLTFTKNRSTCSQRRLCDVFSIFRKDIETLTSKVGNKEDSFEVFSIFIDAVKKYIPLFISNPDDAKITSRMTADILAEIDKKYKYYSLPSNLDFRRLIRSSIVLSRGFVALFYNFSVRNRQELSSYIANNSDPRGRLFKQLLKESLNNEHTSISPIKYNDSIIVCNTTTKKFPIQKIMDRRVFNGIIRRSKDNSDQAVEDITEFAIVSEFPLYCLSF